MRKKTLKLITVFMIELIILLPMAFALSISNVTSQPSQNSAEIRWQTDEPANSTVKYGITTAGNSSEISDGASAIIVMSREKAQELGCHIFGTIGAQASAGIQFYLKKNFKKNLTNAPKSRILTLKYKVL